MALVNCPDCGAQVSDTATVCPQCGFPLRDYRAAQPAVGLRGRAPEGYGAGILTGLAATVLVLLLAIIAAVAIPRVRAASRAAKEAEGEGLLKRAYALQNEYWGRHSTYAGSFEELKSVGWKEPEKPRYYTVEIVSWRAADLCLQALPRPGSGVRPIRMRSAGYVEPGARCDAYGGDSTTVKDDALQALRGAYRGIRTWWYEHQRPPETDAELREAYPAMASDPGFVVGLTPMKYGGLCVHVAPRTQPPSAVAFSMDSGGNVYAGDGCGGTPVAHAYP
jgi:Tfp pilus assembly protein PilE